MTWKVSTRSKTRSSMWSEWSETHQLTLQREPRCTKECSCMVILALAKLCCQGRSLARLVSHSCTAQDQALTRCLLVSVPSASANYSSKRKKINLASSSLMRSTHFWPNQGDLVVNTRHLEQRLIRFWLSWTALRRMRESWLSVPRIIRTLLILPLFAQADSTRKSTYHPLMSMAELISSKSTSTKSLAKTRFSLRN